MHGSLKGRPIDSSAQASPKNYFSKAAVFSQDSSVELEFKLLKRTGARNGGNQRSSARAQLPLLSTKYKPPKVNLTMDQSTIQPSDYQSNSIERQNSIESKKQCQKQSSRVIVGGREIQVNSN